MNPVINWSDEKDIRRVFSYQTRIGVAPAFGSISINWYQCHQSHANNILVEFADGHEIVCQCGVINRKTKVEEEKASITINEVYYKADARVRHLVEHM